MPRALRVCSTPGCPELTKGGRCGDCTKQADQRRGTRQQRGYGKAHTNRFRPGVLRKNPLCVCTVPGHGHGPECLAPSTVADHWPLDKRELVARGMDDHDPANGRGLCKRCHDHHTAVTQPGGWHSTRRDSPSPPPGGMTPYVRLAGTAGEVARCPDP